MKSNNRKLLVPLATLLVAAAVTIGSGATWTSETRSSVHVTSGNVAHMNDKNTLRLDALNLKPGDVSKGVVTITNTGTLESKISIEQLTGAVNGFYSSPSGVSDLQLKVVRDAGTTNAVIYDNDFAEMSTTATDITGSDTLEPGDTTTLTFSVRLLANANKDSQGQEASATFQFVTSPVDGDTGLSGIWR